MQYMLLIYDDEQNFARASEEERQKIFAEYGKFTQELRDRGAMVDGNPLQRTAAATTVRVRDGEALVTDGPFAETKEQLGGYYLIDVDDVDEAIELAAKIPSARLGSIEVRPVMPIMEHA